jgi:hypothetical protein
MAVSKKRLHCERFSIMLNYDGGAQQHFSQEESDLKIASEFFRPGLETSLESSLEASFPLE